jgi:hypothetical protein
MRDCFCARLTIRRTPAAVAEGFRPLCEAWVHIVRPLNRCPENPRGRRADKIAHPTAAPCTVSAPDRWAFQLATSD